jgi:hypothetical protein
MTPIVSDPECLPNIEDLVTEDGAPVDRILTEKQYRLLTSSLYASWAGPGDGRKFLAMVNVGYFFQAKVPPLVPDFLLSLDVECPPDLHVKAGHSYFQWLVGKPPDLVVEIVSDRRGGEDSDKMKQYARLRVAYYVIFDPDEVLDGGMLRVYELQRSRYVPVPSGFLEDVGVGVKLWEGPFEGHTDTWLRWCDRKGNLLATPEEAVEVAKARARDAEEQARVDRLARIEAERQATLAAARIQQLEEALNQVHGGNGKSG